MLLYLLVLNRNFKKDGVGSVEEIGFEEFLTVMSYFRAPTHHITVEQREEMRRTKLRCKNMQKQYSKHSLESRILGDKYQWTKPWIHNTSDAIYFLFLPTVVLFNMHDTDNDGTITLEEYRHVRNYFV